MDGRLSQIPERLGMVGDGWGWLEWLESVTPVMGDELGN